MYSASMMNVALVYCRRDCQAIGAPQEHYVPDSRTYWYPSLLSASEYATEKSEKVILGNYTP